MQAALDETISALADPTRRRVIESLREGPKRAGELARRFGASPPAMSRHLKVLRLRGLVEETRGRDDARSRVYQLRPERLRDLAGWLEELERYWSDQLASFKEHAERRDRQEEPPR